MRKKFVKIFLVILVSLPLISRADEGMWLPLLIQKNYAEMQRLGIKLTPEDIYSVNKSSLKDAIVNFGNFCTGEIISKEGLLLTNHHCGFDAIQAQSSVSNDLLSNGFWAMSRDKELPSPGLTVTFLVRMEDVTDKILPEVSSITDADRKEQKIEDLTNELSAKATEGTHYTAEIKSFYEGNAYYMFIYEVFKDVRMVGAPPSSIGKFGGDTDNWMWPRHTGDFSIFRVYTGPDGKPAEYSKDNIPLKPRHYLPVSLQGIKQGDFAMVMGYPGSTERYMTSEGVKMTYEQSNPARIKIRGNRLEIMQNAMDSDPKIKIMYAAKYAHVSNYYKYFIGQNQGIQKLDVIGKKKEEEKKFQEWVNASAERTMQYGTLLNEYDKIYKDYRVVNLPYIYLEEAAFGSEILELCYKAMDLYSTLKAGSPQEDLKKSVADFRKEADELYKNYDPATDKKIFAALLQLYYEDLDPKFHPEIFQTVEKKYKKDFGKWAESVFKTSFFASEAKMNAFLANPTAKAMERDAAFNTFLSIIKNFRQSVVPALRKVYERLETTDTKFMEAVLKQRANENLYPDANFTMRITYGSVKDYYPRDAVYYFNHTTLKGVMEKEDSTNEEFIVPLKLKDLYRKKDYGKYGQNGEMPVCFITTNDITGGNSGSPVINDRGHLIGTAFDGNWEAMSGDIIFEPELQRCIVTDIRYILFIIDKFAGAGYLVDEMTLVEGPVQEKQEAVKPSEQGKAVNLSPGK